MKIIEALSILGQPDCSKEAVKSAWKQKAKENHPDIGGELRRMQLVNEARDFLFKCIGNGWTWDATQKAKAAEETPLTETINELWNKIKHLPKINIELCGTWVWVSGETKEVKDQLSEAGMKYASKKQMWAWSPPGSKRRYGKKTQPMDKIRAKYGSENLGKSEYNQMAA